MKKSFVFTVAAALALALNLQAADITGTITFKGTAPAEKELTPIKEDPN